MKPGNFVTTVGSSPGSSAPRWLIPAGGEVLRHKGPEETRYGRILVKSGVFYRCRATHTHRSYKTQSCVFIFPNNPDSLPTVTNSDSPVLVPTSA